MPQCSAAAATAAAAGGVVHPQHPRGQLERVSRELANSLN